MSKDLNVLGNVVKVLRPGHQLSSIGNSRAVPAIVISKAKHVLTNFDYLVPISESLLLNKGRTN